MSGRLLYPFTSEVRLTRRMLLCGTSYALLCITSTESTCQSSWSFDGFVLAEMYERSVRIAAADCRHMDASKHHFVF